MSSASPEGPSESIRIGTEIKLLREQRGLSGKDLADLIGLSQSQISRLESGQRRIDLGLLRKLAQVLTVHPAHFLEGMWPEGATPPAANAESARLPVAEPTEHVGKVVRAERRRKHITAEDLAGRISKPTSWVKELESGAVDRLTGEMATRIAKALKLEPKVLFDAQRSTLRDLQLQVARLEQAVAEQSRGALELDDGKARRGVPFYGPLPETLELGADGHPLAEVQDYLYAPELQHAGFAFTATGDEMVGGPSRGFQDGDGVVFSYDREVRHRDFALTVTDGGVCLLRQVFFDPRGIVRLQPLNMDFAALLLHREEVVRSFRVMARLQRF